jgi:hypothetical protein
MPIDHQQHESGYEGDYCKDSVCGSPHVNLAEAMRRVSRRQNERRRAPSPTVGSPSLPGRRKTSRRTITIRHPASSSLTCIKRPRTAASFQDRRGKRVSLRPPRGISNGLRKVTAKVTMCALPPDLNAARLFLAEILGPIPANARRSNDIKIVCRIVCGECEIVLKVRCVNPRIPSAMSNPEGIDVIDKADYVEG